MGSFSLIFGLARILPNLRELTLSDVKCPRLRPFSQDCPSMETVIFRRVTDIDVTGIDLVGPRCLKNVYVDDSYFLIAGNTFGEKLSDLQSPTNQTFAIFWHCNSTLERVSIRNTKWYNVFTNKDFTANSIPQNALIKFVRACPNLRWFRSDLLERNVNMLKLERPDIEFLS